MKNSLLILDIFLINKILISIDLGGLGHLRQE